MFATSSHLDNDAKLITSLKHYNTDMVRYIPSSLSFVFYDEISYRISRVLDDGKNINTFAISFIEYKKCEQKIRWFDLDVREWMYKNILNSARDFITNIDSYNLFELMIKPLFSDVVYIDILSHELLPTLIAYFNPLFHLIKFQVNSGFIYGLLKLDIQAPIVDESFDLLIQDIDNMLNHTL